MASLVKMDSLTISNDIPWYTVVQNSDDLELQYPDHENKMASELFSTSNGKSLNMVMIFGSLGSGKSTLLNNLYGEPVFAASSGATNSDLVEGGLTQGCHLAPKIISHPDSKDYPNQSFADLEGRDDDRGISYELILSIPLVVLSKVIIYNVYGVLRVSKKHLKDLEVMIKAAQSLSNNTKNVKDQFGHLHIVWQASNVTEKSMKNVLLTHDPKQIEYNEIIDNLKNIFTSIDCWSLPDFKRNEESKKLYEEKFVVMRSKMMKQLETPKKIENCNVTGDNINLIFDGLKDAINHREDTGDLNGFLSLGNMMDNVYQNQADGIQKKYGTELSILFKKEIPASPCDIRVYMSETKNKLDECAEKCNLFNNVGRGDSVRIELETFLEPWRKKYRSVCEKNVEKVRSAVINESKNKCDEMIRMWRKEEKDKMELKMLKEYPASIRANCFKKFQTVIEKYGMQENAQIKPEFEKVVLDIVTNLAAECEQELKIREINIDSYKRIVLFVGTEKKKNEKLTRIEEPSWRQLVNYDSHDNNIEHGKNLSLPQIKQRCIEIGGAGFAMKGEKYWIKSRIQAYRKDRRTIYMHNYDIYENSFIFKGNYDSWGNDIHHGRGGTMAQIKQTCIEYGGAGFVKKGNDFWIKSGKMYPEGEKQGNNKCELYTRKRKPQRRLYVDSNPFPTMCLDLDTANAFNIVHLRDGAAFKTGEFYRQHPIDKHTYIEMSHWEEYCIKKRQEVFETVLGTLGVKEYVIQNITIYKNNKSKEIANSVDIAFVRARLNVSLNETHTGVRNGTDSRSYGRPKREPYIPQSYEKYVDGIPSLSALRNSRIDSNVLTCTTSVEDIVFKTKDTEVDGDISFMSHSAKSYYHALHQEEFIATRTYKVTFWDKELFDDEEKV